MSAPPDPDPHDRWVLLALGHDPSATSDPNTPGLPSERAAQAVGALPQEDQAKVQAVLGAAASEAEKGYITQAIAAGHKPDALERFAALIRGEPPERLDGMLRLVSKSTGQGFQQQWSHSCGATSAEAIKAALDPLYAMTLREQRPQEPPDRPAAPTDADASGQGVLNRNFADLGLRFDRTSVGDAGAMEDALDTMQAHAAQGMPVPIDVGQGGEGGAQAAIVTGCDPGPPRLYTIHDPRSGDTRTYTEAQIRNGQIDAGGQRQLVAIFPPSATR